MPLKTISSASAPIDHVPALVTSAGIEALAGEENFLEGLAGGLLKCDRKPGDDQPDRRQQHEAPRGDDAHGAPAAANDEHACQSRRRERARSSTRSRRCRGGRTWRALPPNPARRRSCSARSTSPCRSRRASRCPRPADRGAARASASGRPGPITSIMSTAASSGDWNRNDTAAKVPAAASTVTTCGGASLRARRIVRTPRPEPNAISGASGPSTISEPDRRERREDDPGQVDRQRSGRRPSRGRLRGCALPRRAGARSQTR